MPEKNETTEIGTCPCEVTPPPMDIVIASFDQMREGPVDAGDAVAKSGSAWLERHGHAQRRVYGHHVLTRKGQVATCQQVRDELAECREKRPGLRYDPQESPNA